jgi:hypothetical protein
MNQRYLLWASEMVRDLFSSEQIGELGRYFITDLLPYRQIKHGQMTYIGLIDYPPDTPELKFGAGYYNDHLIILLYIRGEEPLTGDEINLMNDLGNPIECE